MFDWGKALYHAMRWAVGGALVGLAITFFSALSNRSDSAGADPMIELFFLFGIGRLGWELFTKRYPDA